MGIKVNRKSEGGKCGLRSISLKDAKVYLQKNDITEVAKEVGIGQSQASKVMSGKSTNWDFVEKILQRAEHNKALKERAASI